MISLNNRNVAEYLELRLDKLENNFSKEELNSIKELVYDNYTVDNEIIEDNLFDLRYFRELQKLYLINMDIEKDSAKNIFVLPSIEEIKFEKVNFIYTDFISNLKVKSIGFINTNLVDFSFFKKMYDLEKIEVIGAKEIRISFFEQMKNLKELDLGYCNILEYEKIIELSSLEGIYINDTNIKKIDFLINLNFLKFVGLDKEQIDGNIKLIEKLKEKGIKIFINNLIEY